MTSLKHCFFSVFLLLCVTASVAQKSPASESDLKKQAEKLFEKESYAEAVPMYSQLLSLYPRDAIFNYRYGVCLLMSGQDKTGAATYLEAAAKSPMMDPDVNFYLGRSYMYLDHYNEAIAAFNVFKKMGSSAKQNKLQPDIYIKNCENANQLRLDRKNVVVISKVKVSRQAFFAAYDFTSAAGKMLTTPDRFLTAYDKERMPNPVMFMTRDGETIYYGSYGKGGTNGKDIYRVMKLPDGTWSEPVPLNGFVNTDADEDYPYLDRDGRTLYFSSKAHNSMGGFDLFKSQYDFNSGKWSEPVNLGIPVNTVDDDIFYVPSTKGDTAMYATAIESEAGKIELRNIKLGDAVSNLAVITGRYISQDQVTRRDARITVVRTKDNGVVTSVKTDRTGEYELVLPAGEDYMLIVEGGSYLPHAENFSVPGGEVIPGMQQMVVMNKGAAREEMTMTNYFTPSANDPTTASVEKPTQVARSEFDLKDTASSKMQAITFDGKTLYVAPPSVKSSQQLRTNTNDSNPSTVARAVQPEPKQEVIAEEKKTSDAVSTDEKKTSPESAAADTTAEPVAASATSTSTSPSTPSGTTEKVSNAEVVKIAFDDAISMKEEAATMRASAEEKRGESKSLDSLSKEQVRQANELIASGDKEQSQQLFKESKENAVAADEKMKEAQALESDAAQKDTEYISAIQQAKDLMKEFRVDTTSASYQAIVLKDSSALQEEHAMNDISSEVQEEKTPAIAHPSEDIYAEGSHTVKSKKLAEEAEHLLNAAIDMDQKAESATAKNEKSQFQKKSKDLKKQSDEKLAESKKESALALKANEQPVIKADEIAQENASGKSSEESVAANPAKSEGAANTAASGVDNNNKDSENISSESQTEKIQDQVAEENKPVEISNSTAENITATTAHKNESEIESGNTTTSASIKAPDRNYDAVKASPEAIEHYKNYEQSLFESKQIEEQSKAAEAGLVKKNSKETRDSLEKLTTELNIQSIRQWQVSQKELALAKAADPEIEQKVKDGEAAQMNSTVSGKADETAIANSLGSQNTEQAPNPVHDQVQETGSEPVAEVLDTTKPDYPKYVETKKEILEKQTETVDIFVEGMKMSKQATAIKADEMKLRDQAVATADKKERERLEVKADSLAMEADMLSTKSKDMLAAAQKNTGYVKELTARSEKLKEGLVVKDQTLVQPSSTETSAQNNSPAAGQTGVGADHEISKVQAAESKNANEARVLRADSANGNRSATESLASEVSKSDQPQTDSATASKSNTAVEEFTTLEKEERNPAPQLVQPSTAASRTSFDSSAVSENKPDNIRGAQSDVVGSKDIQQSAETPKGNDTNENPVAIHQTSTEGGHQDQDNHQDDTAPVSGQPASDQTKAEKEPEPQIKNGSGIDSKSSTGNMNSVQENKAVPSASITQIQEDVKSIPDMNFEKEISDASTFSLSKGESYGSSQPIPMDPALPEGLVFKVQIGAFRKPLPDNTFKNLQPLSGETTRPGWIRYCLGLFRTFEPANLLKKEVRAMGYPDAFVVAYYNGKRIPLFDAYAMISKANAASKKSYAAETEKEFNHLAKFEIKKSNYSNKPDEDSKAFFGTVENVPASLVEYAVQVGVYKTSRTPSALSTLLPLNTEQTTTGLYRFTTGRFENRSAADSMKRVAVAAGIKDAFVVIYRGGKKAGEAESRKILAEAKAVAKTAVKLPETQSTSVPETQSVAPLNPSDVIFKIQLGAFRENVPFNTVSSFLSIADKGISQETDVRGLHIFYAGQFSRYEDALAAKAEIASKGVKDAFIVAFVKGQRMTATEALKRLNGN